MSNKLTLVGQISFLFLVFCNSAFAEEIRLPIRAESIETRLEGPWGFGYNVGFLTDARDGQKTGVICGRPKGSNTVVLTIFGRELELRMNEQECVRQLSTAIQKIKSEGALGLSITSKDISAVESIQAF